MLTCEIVETIGKMQHKDGSDMTMSEFITDYDITITEKDPAADGGFMTWDGKIVTKDGQVLEHKRKVVSISFSMANVPQAWAKIIADCLQNDDEGSETNGIEIKYADPQDTSGFFLLTNYNAVSRRFGDTWNIDMSFTTDGVIDKTSGGGL